MSGVGQLLRCINMAKLLMLHKCIAIGSQLAESKKFREVATSSVISRQDLYLLQHAMLENSGRTLASYELELKAHCELESKLQAMLAKSEALIHQQQAALEYQALLQRESNHRLLNDMQMVVSLLGLQGRTSSNAETAAELIKAASRVSMIACIHRRLQSIEGVKTVAFRQYLLAFCKEFSAMLEPQKGLARVTIPNGPELQLPAATAVPLAFIVSELLTNAVKYGDGCITIRLEAISDKRHMLSVSNDGPALPENFDPAACKGLGMKILQTFLRKIAGELRFGPGDGGRGAYFQVFFA